MHPEDLIEAHFRVTKDQKAALKRLSLNTIQDILWHFPVRYQSMAESSQAAHLVPGNTVTLFGQLTKLEAKRLWKSRRPATQGWFEDGTGRVKVMWFNQPYIAKMVPQNTPIKLSGAVSGSEKSPYITNPEIESVAADAIPEPLLNMQGGEQEAEHTLFPVYPESRGVTSKWFYHTMKRILTSGVLEELEDVIPPHVAKQYNLPRLSSALVYIHAPKDARDAEGARKRFAFEEIFVIQVAKQKERALNNTQEALPVVVDDEKIAAFIDTLPYPLTGAQARAVNEILGDFAKQHPMARLLEGDVGSGKTAVAAATSYAVVTSRPAGRSAGTLQVAYMAPTEILSSQHFQSFIEMYRELPINIALITGSGCYKFPSKLNRERPTKISRAQMLKWVANGEIAIVIGTHALIQKSVEFQNLAYVIVDEQHRFGTAQRKALAKKGEAVPHFLSMTATPIPRTLALTIYGDLDISVLDELPPNRASVETKIVSPKERELAYETVREEIEKGRQAYVICPRIEEPDPGKAMALRVKSARAEAKRLQKEVFTDYKIGLMHGKLKPKEKDEVMDKFNAGEIDVLVSTSVVEVGVNVQNATSIIIEGAERFGLSQLHQLRGRVQRSSHKAHCFLFSDAKMKESRDRLRAMADTSNGFALAEADMMLRGMGDFYGRKQWGISDLAMEALKNARLIEAARKEAQAIVAKEPELADYPALAKRAEHLAELFHDE